MLYPLMSDSMNQNLRIVSIQMWLQPLLLNERNEVSGVNDEWDQSKNRPLWNASDAE